LSLSVPYFSLPHQHEEDVAAYRETDEYGAAKKKHAKKKLEHDRVVRGIDPRRGKNALKGVDSYDASDGDPREGFGRAKKFHDNPYMDPARSHQIGAVAPYRSNIMMSHGKKHVPVFTPPPPPPASGGGRDEFDDAESNATYADSRGDFFD
jgi:hypothetical protein